MSFLKEGLYPLNYTQRKFSSFMLVFVKHLGTAIMKTDRESPWLKWGVVGNRLCGLQASFKVRSGSCGAVHNGNQRLI